MNTTPRNEINLIETVERIVINYANFSGRETENRATFRRLTEEHIRSLMQSERTALIEEILPKVQKFIDKVESGHAKSKETYADMKEIKEFLSHLESGNEETKI